MKESALTSSNRLGGAVISDRIVASLLEELRTGRYARADQGLIKQVMRILMDNSVKYSPPDGRVYLRVTAQEGYARVTVQDEGMGIAPQGIPHIFDRFYRTDQSRDRRTGGTGLGLSIAKWIVDRHGGWFEVVSREGVGTRISFLLPSAPASTEEEAL